MFSCWEDVCIPRTEADFGAGIRHIILGFRWYYSNEAPFMADNWWNAYQISSIICKYVRFSPTFLRVGEFKLSFFVRGSAFIFCTRVYDYENAILHSLQVLNDSLPNTVWPETWCHTDALIFCLALAKFILGSLRSTNLRRFWSHITPWTPIVFLL